MKNKIIKIACLLSVLMIGMMSSALTALTPVSPAVKLEKTQEIWNLLETKDGVTCYYRIDQLGTGNGVYLRFVNAASSDVTVDFIIMDGEKATNSKLTVAAGQTLDSSNALSLAIRLASDKPVISFTVSK
ncbi:hypothetical protein BH11BAC7_BH11BAC7_16020 [soil metagenome]